MSTRLEAGAPRRGGAGAPPRRLEAGAPPPRHGARRLGPARRRRVLGGLLVVIAGAALLPGAARAARLDSTVLARVPDPGFTALTVLGKDRTIYGGTFFPASGNGGDGVPSHVFAWSPDGTLEHDWPVTGQDLSADHGVQATVRDAQGRIYLLDTSPARVIRLDPATGAQTTWATIPDLKPCATPGQRDCSATTLDMGSEPDYAAWGPDGALYVTDDTQATIFRIPPGGGAAKVWLTDARFDALAFGITGLALTPDRSALAATTVGSSPTADANAASGSLVEIPFRADGSPGTIRTVWRSGEAEAPDGFAYSAARDVYIALLGPGVDQVVEVSPAGQELARFPSAVQQAALPVPYDSPASVTFDGSRLIVTNDAYFTADRAHQVLFAVDAGEPGAPLFVPGEPLRYAVVVRHAPARAGRTVTLRVQVTPAGDAVLPAGSTVRVGARRLALPSGGRVVVRFRPKSAGVFRVRVRVPGSPSQRIRVHVRRTRHATAQRHA